MVSIITDVGVLAEGMSRHLAFAAGNVQGGEKRDGY